MTLLNWSHLLVASLCTMGAYLCMRDREYLLLPFNMFFASLNLAYFWIAIMRNLA
jgi:hypothetical protein